jgi:CheY-like chemotaxis protein
MHHSSPAFSTTAAPHSPFSADDATILIVGDETDDMALASHFLMQAGLCFPRLHLRTAEAAITHLTACLEGAEPMPRLVFVDLKMRAADGFTVLDWMRRQPALQRTLTVVLNSSTASSDVARAVALGAKAFLSRHPQVGEIRTVLQLAASIRTVEELDRVITRRGLDALEGLRAEKYLARQAKRGVNH